MLCGAHKHEFTITVEYNTHMSFALITAQHSQADMLYLQQLCSDHKGEIPLDTQLEADGEAGEKEHIDNMTTTENTLGLIKNCFLPILFNS